MNKKILIYSIFLIVLCSFASAEVLEYRNLSKYGLSDYFIDKPANANLGYTTSGQQYVESALDEIKHGRWRTTGSGNLISYIDPNNITFDNSSGKQIFFEMNISTGGGAIKASEGAGARDTFDFNNAVAGKIRIGSGGGTVVSSRTYFNADLILKAMYGSSGLINFEIYNVTNANSLIENLTLTNPATVYSGNFMPRMYAYTGNFNISWYMIFNGSLYTSIFVDTPDTYTPTLSGLNRNMTNNTLGQLINFTCSNNRSNLWFGVNITNMSIVINQATANIMYNLNSTTINAQNDYYWRAGCNGSMGTNTTIYRFTYDTTAPSITRESTTNIAADNSTILYSRILKLNFSFSDAHQLYAFEINITNSTGFCLYNLTNQSLTTTSYNIYREINITNFPTGFYKVSILSADSHNPKTISYGIPMDIDLYDVTKSEDKKMLTFETIDPYYI